MNNAPSCSPFVAAIPRVDLKSFFLALQMVGLFLALLFTAGGGVMPGQEAGEFVYIKAFLLSVPLMTCALLFLIRPRDVLLSLLDILHKNKWFLLYMAACFLSLPLAVDTGFSLNRLLYTVFGTVSVLSVMICYTTFYPDACHRQKIFSEHLRVLSACLLFFIMALVWRHGVYDLVPGIRTTLVQNFPTHPNVMASYLGHLFLLFFCHALVGRGGSGWAVALSIAIILLFSRAVLFGLFASMAVIALFNFIWYGRRFFLGIVLVMVLCVLLAAFGGITGAISLDSLLGIFSRNEPLENFLTLTNRTTLWQEILSDLSFKEWMLGHGYAVITEDFGVDFETGTIYGAHNAYLSIFLGAGVLSLLLFLIWMVSNFIHLRALRCVHSPAITLSVLGSLTFFLINSLFEEQVGIATSASLAHILLLINLYHVPFWRPDRSAL